MYEMLQKILEVAEFKRTEYDTVVANFKKLRESGYKKREPNLSEMINASIQSIAIDHKLKGVLYGGNYMNLYFRKMAKFPEERWFLDVKNAIEKAGGGLTISHENKGIIRRWVDWSININVPTKNPILTIEYYCDGKRMTVSAVKDWEKAIDEGKEIFNLLAIELMEN